MDISASLAKMSPEVRITSRLTEAHKAYELVYNCYRARGYAPRETSVGLYYQDRFGRVDSRTLLATHSELGQSLGTLTIVGDTQEGLGLDVSFPGEAAQLRRDGARMAEVTALATSPNARDNSANVFFALSRFMFQYVVRRKYTHVVMVIHPRHTKFYRRLFDARTLGEVRPYPLARNFPGVACLIDLASLQYSMAEAESDWIFQPPIATKQLDLNPLSEADHAKLHWMANEATLSTQQQERDRVVSANRLMQAA